MAYGDDWERFCLWEMRRWRRAVIYQEVREWTLPPDDRLDDLGWDIYFYCTGRGMGFRGSSRQAMNGHLRARLRVRDDRARSWAAERERRFAELHPFSMGLNAVEQDAHEQLAFWERSLGRHSYVYFIQEGAHGRVKIGRSVDPFDRRRDLQTGNSRGLHLRYVLPGGRDLERQLHRRFRSARIRGEWFGGPAYLPLILTFGKALAGRMAMAYDGSGEAPRVEGSAVLTPKETIRLRDEIERLAKRGNPITEIAAITEVPDRVIRQEIKVMRHNGAYVLPRRLADDAA